VLQLVSTFFFFFVPAVGAAMLMSRKPFKWLGYKEGFNIKQFLLVIAIMVLCFPLVGALGELNQLIPIPKSWELVFKKLEDSYSSQVESLATIRSVSEFIFSLIVLALLPALFEETIFRGGFQQLLTGWFKKPAAAIIVTSIIFSAIHFSYYGFLARLALGIILGLLFYFSKSIWLSITAHFLNNAIAVSYMYYLSLHGKPAKDLEDTSLPIWWAVPSLILLVLAFRQYKQISQQRLINKIPPMDGPSVESNLA
jgi:membrane protease YdiL (CAAX protease family)